MTLRLYANQEAQALTPFLHDDDAPLAVLRMDITSCILATPDELLRCIWRCTELRSLHCVACPLKACDLLSLLLHRLRKLERLDFSLVAQCDVDRDISSVRAIAQQAQGLTASSLRSVYAEVRDSSNCNLLEALLAFCPNLSELHVHFVNGDFSYALLRCAEVHGTQSQLNNVTFSSDVPVCLQLDIPAALDLQTSMQICANVSYSKSALHTYSCARLVDLAFAHASADLPPQLVVVAVYKDELLAQRIRMASRALSWKTVRQLCLVLVPPEPMSTDYPTVGVEYLSFLHEFFVAVVSHVVELNVNSFHFGVDLDLTQLIQNACMNSLRALSVPPCGLSHPSALRRLANKCPRLEELDVRFYRRGRLARCAVCECPFFLHASDVALLNADVPYTRRWLCRLTLSDLPSLASLCFLERCKVEELRLVNCPETLREEYAMLGQFLANNNHLRYLLLQQDWLPFGEQSFLPNLFHLRGLHYLCLLTAASVPDDTATFFLRCLDFLLPCLKVAHVHYRRPTDGAEQRVTWMRSCSATGSQVGRGVVLRDRPCVLCSTATFIGLAKPQRHHFSAA
ncbi:hypothetical protein HPB49_001919 [Dermacentor silvarum]|uniref:Uncharacterized protein n=1 Tax=Dermacentor silvarum TaxID=543639 RepID=A0ACB8CUR8_DERSI|nr:hypothetical protein HPB49_001919 [Dermacentor silvarum]